MKKMNEKNVIDIIFEKIEEEVINISVNNSGVIGSISLDNNRNLKTMDDIIDDMSSGLVPDQVILEILKNKISEEEVKEILSLSINEKKIIEDIKIELIIEKTNNKYIFHDKNEQYSFVLLEMELDKNDDLISNTKFEDYEFGINFYNMFSFYFLNKDGSNKEIIIEILTDEFSFIEYLEKEM